MPGSLVGGTRYGSNKKEVGAMVRYSVETRRKPEEVLKEAAAFFGPGGLGLEMVEQNPCCLTFQGGGGHVSVSVSTGEKKTVVDLETREWDFQVREFMRKIA
jgi:hypothetical protein